MEKWKQSDDSSELKADTDESKLGPKLTDMDAADAIVIAGFYLSHLEPSNSAEKLAEYLRLNFTTDTFVTSFAYNVHHEPKLPKDLEEKSYILRALGEARKAKALIYQKDEKRGKEFEVVMTSIFGQDEVDNHHELDNPTSILHDETAEREKSIALATHSQTIASLILPSTGAQHPWKLLILSHVHSAGWVIITAWNGDGDFNHSFCYIAQLDL